MKENIATINTPSMYHRQVRDLGNLAHYKAIEFYMIFAYCTSAFKGILSEAHFNIMERIKELISTIMNPFPKDSTEIKLFEFRVSILLQNIEKELGSNCCTLATHSVKHFPE